jgi:hypothetical protein
VWSESPERLLDHQSSRVTTDRHPASFCVVTKQVPSFVGQSMTSTTAAIKYQDALGNWITVMTVPNQPPLILSGVKGVAVLYPGKRVRAVDQDGKLIDML